MTRTVIARAPTRIDFGGGWTDVPPYPETDGGCVCNVAISRYATVQVAAEGSARTTIHDADAADGGALVAAAVQRAALRGARVTVTSDFPIGAGLGGSSAVGVALQGAIRAWHGDPAPVDLAAIAEASRAVEVEDLGVAGGRQDHYAAAFGGALGLRFTDRVDVQRIPLTRQLRDTLASRLVLVYTGESRISGDTITAVIDAYRRQASHVVDALRRMGDLARQMITALSNGDVDTLGALVAEHWTHQRSLHPAIPTPRIDTILEQGRAAGAIGGKACGASGGGCVVLIASEQRVDDVRRAVASLGRLIPFAIDDVGLALSRTGGVDTQATAWASPAR